MVRDMHSVEGMWERGERDAATTAAATKGVAGILGKGKPWKRKKVMVGKCNLTFRRLV